VSLTRRHGVRATYVVPEREPIGRCMSTTIEVFSDYVSQ